MKSNCTRDLARYKSKNSLLLLLQKLYKSLQMYKNSVFAFFFSNTYLISSTFILDPRLCLHQISSKLVSEFMLYNFAIHFKFWKKCKISKIMHAETKPFRYFKISSHMNKTQIFKCWIWKIIIRSLGKPREFNHLLNFCASIPIEERNEFSMNFFQLISKVLGKPLF